jgi:hypothetical protein
MNPSKSFGKILLISSVLSLMLHPPSFSAQNCIPLKAVGGEEGQTIVQKTVSAPRIPIGIGNLNRDNWNTDFAIASNGKYKRFVATVTPQTDGIYSIKMSLKYSDGTADEVYNSKPNLSPGKPLVLSGTPRAKEQPYQVNVFVGDAESIAKSYKIAVEACR